MGSGLQAQKLNPEIKVRSADPVLLELKEKLELFNQVGPTQPDPTRAVGALAFPIQPRLAVPIPHTFILSAG